MRRDPAGTDGSAAVDRVSPPGSAPVPRSDLGSTVVADHLVLHDARAHRTHVLNPTSARIWDALDGHRTTAAIVERLAEDAGVATEVVARDVDRALAQFASVRLLDPAPRVAPEPPPPTSVPPSPTTSSTAAAQPEEDDAAPRARGSRKPRSVGTTARLALGAAVEVRTDDPVLAADLDDALGSLPPADGADHAIDVVGDDGDGYRVVVDDVPVGGVPTRRDAIEAVVSSTNQLAVAHTPGRLLLHAGAVERHGRAVVVLGPSGRGKSTLTAALVQAGFAYLTDEVAAVEPDTGRIDPFPKPLALAGSAHELLGLATPPRDEVAPARGKHLVAPARLGAVSAGGRFDLLVLLEDPDPTVPLLSGGPEPDAPREVISFLALLEQTFAETMGVPDALGSLGRTYRKGRVLRLRRTDLATMVRTVVATC